MLSFWDNWDKLEDEEYTTIRGKDFPKRNTIQAGEMEPIYLKKKYLLHTVLIQKIIYSKIKDIPIEILKRDVMRKGKTIQTHEQFINLLNEPQFNMGWVGKNRMDTVKSILYCKKINVTTEAVVDIPQTQLLEDFL